MAVILSILPIILLFVLMLGFKMAGHKSAFITLIVTAIIALFARQAGITTPDYFSQSAVGWAFIEGVLKAFTADSLTIDMNGTEKQFTRADVSLIKLALDF